MVGNYDLCKNERWYDVKTCAKLLELQHFEVEEDSNEFARIQISDSDSDFDFNLNRIQISNSDFRF